MDNHEYSHDPTVQEARRVINATSDFGAEVIATLITSKTPEVKEATSKLDNEYLSTPSRKLDTEPSRSRSRVRA